ncbi:MAG: NAD-dependent epimerase/dehydratase family protein [Planctomycetota bacterium]|jgi:nucleoside-diphosphate-sugar epimerase
MAKIIITGGSGFIGTNLIETLESEHHILNIDTNPARCSEQEPLRSSVDILNADALAEAVSEFKPEYLVHLAARVALREKNNLAGYKANHIGTDNVINACMKCQSLKSVLFTSTMLVCKAGYKPESHTDFCPPNLYGESKVKGEELVREQCIKAKYRWGIIRPASIWGPWFGEPYKPFFELVKRGLYFHPGRNSCTKTYGYVGNTVYQIKQLLFSDDWNSGEVFYLGDNPPTLISDWAEEIAAAANSHVRTLPISVFKFLATLGDIFGKAGLICPITSYRLTNMITDNILDLKAIEKLAPDPPFTRQQGIEKTLEWMNQYL